MMIQRIFRGAVVAACAALACWGCSKSVAYDTLYVLRPYVQDSTDAEMRSLPGLRAYAFQADTTQWCVASYEEALAGTISMRYAPDTKRSDPVAVATAYPASDTIPASVNWVQMRVQLSSALIVAVDTENKLYAYCQQEFHENLSPYILSVAFRPWKGAFYQDKDWWMFNDFYVPEPEEPDEGTDTPDGGTDDSGNPDAPAGGTDTPDGEADDGSSGNDGTTSAAMRRDDWRWLR